MLGVERKLSHEEGYRAMFAVSAHEPYDLRHLVLFGPSSEYHQPYRAL